MGNANILLIGAGGHARACVDVIEMQGYYRIIGFLGLAAEVGTTVFGYPVLGADDDLPAFRRKADAALVAVGQIKSPDARIRFFDMLEREGWELPSIVSPRAHVSRHASIGAGTIVMHHAVVNAGASIGRNCIINSQALVEHDCVVADHCHVSTNAALNSGVRVGRGTFVGSSAVVRQQIVIGERCVIGMGERVRRNCADGSLVAGRLA